jgi:hypothetical protein
MIRDAALKNGRGNISLVRWDEKSRDDTWPWTRFKHWSAAALLTLG